MARWVSLPWAWNDLGKVQTAQEDSHGGRWVRAGGVSAEVWKLYLSLFKGLLESGWPEYISTCSGGGGSVVSELEVSQFSPPPQTKVGISLVLPWAQSCDCSGMNRMKEICVHSQHLHSRLSVALPFVNHTSPGWEMRGDVSHCLAHSHSSLCCSAVWGTARCTAEHCAGPTAPSRDEPEPGWQLPVF